MKIVINTCYGGFGLSEKALAMLDVPKDEYPSFERNDPKLVEVVEKLGAEANSVFADLKVVEIPDDVKWHIEEYDGTEWVAENHQKWY